MSNVLDQVVEVFESAPDLVSLMMGARSKPPILLAIDIGTSGIRAALFDETGAEISGTSVRTNRRFPEATDFSTIDAGALLAQVIQTIDAVLNEAQFYEGPTRIELVAISCFWHSLVGVDQTGRATTPVLGWADNRAGAAASELRSKMNEGEVHARTGCRLHPSYWPAKLLRLQNEEPEVFTATTSWLSFTEYLSLHLFGETAVSVSMASGTGLLNQRTCEWDQELLAALDLSVASLPEIASAERTFYGLEPDYAARWPQLSEARMGPGIGDGAANTIGVGCTAKKRVALMIGTSGAMRVLFAGEPPANIPPELWCYRADRTRVIVGGALSDGGALHQWLREALVFNYDAESLENELGRLQPDAHGLTILPFWAGERSTGWNSDARGTILGLCMQTRPIEILRAALEAIAYRFALIATALEPFAPGATIFASGNALRVSPTWMQILADVLGRRVLVSEASEASLHGAALLALEAAGKIRSIEEFSVPVEMVFEPNMLHHAVYSDALDRQQRLYKKIFTETGTPQSGQVK